MTSPRLELPVRDLEHADRLLLVFSDVEIGAGGVTDDFPQSETLGELLLAYNEPPFAAVDIDLIFNGDTFDFLKTSVDDHYPTHVSAELALSKLARIERAHSELFQSLRYFVSHEPARRSISFVVGNHDAELLFEEVQARLIELIGRRDRIRFPGFSLSTGDVWIEHGSQDDPLFKMDPHAPFVEYQGHKILNLPWGSVALIDVAVPFQPKLYALDRVKPRDEVMRLLPDFEELIVTSYWQYWTRDFWRYFAADPIRKVSWTMLKEVIYRFRTVSPEVHGAELSPRVLHRSKDHSVFLFGHLHEPALWTWGSRRILRTGAFRNEFMIRDEGRGLEPSPNVYAEIYMKGGRAFRSQLIELAPPPLPEGYAIESVFDALPIVRELLDALEDRDKKAAEAATQSEKEASAEEAD